MRNNSFRIALMGICCGLSVIFMLLSGVFPFATYALPAISGIMLIPVMAEFGGKGAYFTFLGALILSIFIVPDKEAVLMFFAVLGHYPITKAYLDRIKPFLPRILVKLLVFNVPVILVYAVGIYLLGLLELSEGMNDFGRWTSVILLGTGNIVFLLYDYGLKNIIAFYFFFLKPRFIDKLGGRR